jgi:hypothetical protein
MARKVGLDITKDELPRLPDDDQLGGNEMEGILVRSMRSHRTRSGGEPEPLADVIRTAIEDFRPSAHRDRLELMDLLAVKECTDRRFLPPAYQKLSIEDVNRRIEKLRLRIAEP